MTTQCNLMICLGKVVIGGRVIVQILGVLSFLSIILASIVIVLDMMFDVLNLSAF
jgi:hypothetical protein